MVSIRLSLVYFIDNYSYLLFTVYYNILMLSRFLAERYIRRKMSVRTKSYWKKVSKYIILKSNVTEVLRKTNTKGVDP